MRTMRVLLVALLTAALAPLAVAPLAAADPAPDVGPSGCVVDGGMAPERCDANFINDINGLGVVTLSVEDDGSVGRAAAIEVGHHIVNNLDRAIRAKAQQSGGSTDARGVADAFVKVVQQAISDSQRNDRCPFPDQPCTATNLNVEQATRLVELAIHWYGPPGMENVVKQSVQAVKGGGG